MKASALSNRPLRTVGMVLLAVFVAVSVVGIAQWWTKLQINRQEMAYGSIYFSAAWAKAMLKSNPHNAKAHRTLARAYFDRMYEDHEYLTVPENSPQFLLTKRRLLTPAIAEYKLALQDDPNNPITMWDLAAAYNQTHQWDKAIACYEKVELYQPEKEGAILAIQSIQNRRKQAGL